MASEFRMQVAGMSGGPDDWSFSCSEGDLRQLTATDPRGRTWRSPGDDWFDALQQIRLQLETEGYIPLCNGSRIDAHPSRMSRDMSGGTVLYLHRQKWKARKRVYIFDPATKDKVGTVAEQNEFYKKWLAGPKLPNLLASLTAFARENRARRG